MPEGYALFDPYPPGLCNVRLHTSFRLFASLATSFFFLDLTLLFVGPTPPGSHTIDKAMSINQI